MKKIFLIFMIIFFSGCLGNRKYQTTINEIKNKDGTFTYILTQDGRGLTNIKKSAAGDLEIHTDYRDKSIMSDILTYAGSRLVSEKRIN